MNKINFSIIEFIYYLFSIAKCYQDWTHLSKRVAKAQLCVLNSIFNTYFVSLLCYSITIFSSSNYDIYFFRARNQFILTINLSLTDLTQCDFNGIENMHINIAYKVIGQKLVHFYLVEKCMMARYLLDSILLYIYKNKKNIRIIFFNQKKSPHDPKYNLTIQILSFFHKIKCIYHGSSGTKPCVGNRTMPFMSICCMFGHLNSNFDVSKSENTKKKKRNNTTHIKFCL